MVVLGLTSTAGTEAEQALAALAPRHAEQARMGSTTSMRQGAFPWLTRVELAPELNLW